MATDSARDCSVSPVPVRPTDVTNLTEEWNQSSECGIAADRVFRGARPADTAVDAPGPLTDANAAQNAMPQSH
jgi:hypothetical protein